MNRASLEIALPEQITLRRQVETEIIVPDGSRRGLRWAVQNFGVWVETQGNSPEVLALIKSLQEMNERINFKECPEVRAALIHLKPGETPKVDISFKPQKGIYTEAAHLVLTLPWDRDPQADVKLQHDDGVFGLSLQRVYKGQPSKTLLQKVGGAITANKGRFGFRPWATL